MIKTTLISEMLKFHFGRKIFCSDGEDGVLVHVIFDPATRRMTHIGVKQGRLFGKAVHLPFDSVVSASGDGVTLPAKRADVAAATGEEQDGSILNNKSLFETPASSPPGLLTLIPLHPDHA